LSFAYVKSRIYVDPGHSYYWYKFVFSYHDLLLYTKYNCISMIFFRSQLYLSVPQICSDPISSSPWGTLSLLNLASGRSIYNKTTVIKRESFNIIIIYYYITMLCCLIKTDLLNIYMHKMSFCIQETILISTKM
jgi:hypothetical protein